MNSKNSLLKNYLMGAILIIVVIGLAFGAYELDEHDYLMKLGYILVSFIGVVCFLFCSIKLAKSALSGEFNQATLALTSAAILCLGLIFISWLFVFIGLAGLFVSKLLVSDAEGTSGNETAEVIAEKTKHSSPSKTLNDESD